MKIKIKFGVSYNPLIVELRRIVIFAELANRRELLVAEMKMLLKSEETY